MSTTTEPQTQPQTRMVATGGMLFAGTVMVLSGIFQIFQGIAGIAKDHIFVSTANYAFKFDTTAWGWTHLILGILVALTGFAVFTAAPWARVVGIFLVGLQALSSFMFLPYYPFWALTILALDIFIIWALASGPANARMYDGDPGRDEYMMGGRGGTGSNYDDMVSRRLG
jgi:hypothetical protein